MKSATNSHTAERIVPLSNRISRKAIPIGGKAAWWYAEQNGDITIYGTSYKGEAFSCVIKARGLKVITRRTK